MAPGNLSENPDPAGTPGTSQAVPEDYPEVVKGETLNQGITFFGKIRWVFLPLFPYYEAVKSSDARVNKCISIAEHIFFRVTILLTTNESEVDETSKEIREDHDLFTLAASILECMYRIWFIAYTNIRQSVDYIEAMYEEIVPLIPDEEPPFAAVNKEAMAIRDMCLYATGHMLSRLCRHAKISIHGFMDKFNFD